MTGRHGGSRQRTVEWTVLGKKRGKDDNKQGPAVRDDLCVVIDNDGHDRHQFVAETPDQLLLTDITEHNTFDGMLYLCAVKGTFPAEIVGYSIDLRMKASLVVNDVRNFARMRGNADGCFVSSGRGYV